MINFEKRKHFYLQLLWVFFLKVYKMISEDNFYLYIGPKQASVPICINLKIDCWFFPTELRVRVQSIMCTRTLYFIKHSFCHMRTYEGVWDLGRTRALLDICFLHLDIIRLWFSTNQGAALLKIENGFPLCTHSNRSIYRWEKTTGIWSINKHAQSGVY